MLIVLDILNGYLAAHDPVNPGGIGHDDGHKYYRSEEQQLQSVTAGAGIPYREAAGRMGAGGQDKWKHRAARSHQRADYSQGAYDERCAYIMFNRAKDNQ